MKVKGGEELTAVNAGGNVMAEKGEDYYAVDDLGVNALDHRHLRCSNLSGRPHMKCKLFS